MKIMVLLWSTSVEKDSNIVPSLFSLIFFPFFSFSFSFSFFFVWASLASFIWYGLLWPLLFSLSPETHPNLWGNHSFHHPFLTWDNALIMMIITLLFTYNSWLQQKDMTLYECMTMMVRVIMNGMVELHGNISRNGYGNAIIGRYGGCFEEGKR